MRPRKLFYRRAFLNKPGFESTGMILASARLDDVGDLNADLIIGDCSRQVSLDFCLNPSYVSTLDVKGEIANLRHKADELRKTVNDFLDGVEVGLLIIEKGDA